MIRTSVRTASIRALGASSRAAGRAATPQRRSAGSVPQRSAHARPYTFARGAAARDAKRASSREHTLPWTCTSTHSHMHAHTHMHAHRHRHWRRHHATPARARHGFSAMHACEVVDMLLLPTRPGPRSLNALRPMTSSPADANIQPKLTLSQMETRDGRTFTDSPPCASKMGFTRVDE